MELTRRERMIASHSGSSRFHPPAYARCRAVRWTLDWPNAPRKIEPHA